MPNFTLFYKVFWPVKEFVRYFRPHKKTDDNLFFAITRHETGQMLGIIEFLKGKSDVHASLSFQLLLLMIETSQSACKKLDRL